MCGSRAWCGRGTRPARGATVALKTYSRGAFEARGGESAEAELRSLAVSGGHAGVVALHEVAACEDAAYAVLEYAPYGDLYDRLEAAGPLPAREVASVARQLAGALAHCHARGVAHRDVSPENVVVGAGGTLKLVDFGLSGAMALDGSLPAREPVGKLFYMAPELLERAPHLGAPADMWSLGCVLFLMLTGSPAWEAAAPADGDGGEDAYARVTARGDLEGLLLERGAPPCPRELLDVLSALLAEDPRARPSAAEVLASPWLAAPECAACGAGDAAAERFLGPRTLSVVSAAMSELDAAGDETVEPVRNADAAECAWAVASPGSSACDTPMATP